MSLFASTAEFYQEYRSGIPNEVAELLNETAPVGLPRRLLDVGTGTGFVIQALLSDFDEAIGVDPDVDLLAVAHEQLRSASNVRLIHGNAEEFSIEPGWLAHLVTVCRAFHWFDAPAFLSHVIDFMAPNSVLAILGDQSIWAGGDLWKERAREVVQHVLGDVRRAGAGTYVPPERRFTDDLVKAGFTDVTSTFLPVQRIRSVDSVIGLLHSMSFASPAVLGERLDEFDSRVREELVPLADVDGNLMDHNEFYVYTARMP